MPNEPIQNACKANMSKAIKKLLNYPAGRETLILVLCIEKFENKILKISITDLGGFISDKGEVFLKFSSNINVEAQTLYHEINHWIHHMLGLPMISEIAGDFSTPFEKDFLQLKDQTFYRSNAKKIEEKILPHESSYLVDIDKERALKIFDIQITWDTLEELWNIVGFADVNNVIYINCLSDMDLQNKASWGHTTDYLSENRNEVLMKLYEEGGKKPDSKALEIWLKLHKKQEDTKCLFIFQYHDEMMQKLEVLFNITPTLRKIDKEHLLNMLLYISASSNWIYENDLLKQWKENNPELFEKIDDLQKQADTIFEDYNSKVFNIF